MTLLECSCYDLIVKYRASAGAQVRGDLGEIRRELKPVASSRSRRLARLQALSTNRRD